MKIGLNTDGFGALPLAACLDQIAELGLTHVEFGLGGWSSAPHVDIADLLAHTASRDRLKGMLKERNLQISALNCSGIRCIRERSGSTTANLPMTRWSWPPCSASNGSS